MHCNIIIDLHNTINFVFFTLCPCYVMIVRDIDRMDFDWDSDCFVQIQIKISIDLSRFQLEF